MKKTICDRCKRELVDGEELELTISGKVDEYFDLCPECSELLIDWLASIGKEAEPAPEEDPMYGGPRNDKVHYTVRDLADKYNVEQPVVQVALNNMSVQKYQRDGQMRYLLGKADMDRFELLLEWAKKLEAIR